MSQYKSSNVIIVYDSMGGLCDNLKLMAAWTHLTQMHGTYLTA